MYNFLELVNKVCRRFNEAELTSSNFSSSSARGFYAAAKDAVNASIRDINQSHFQWPWNHITYSETLGVGQLRYAFQADAKNVDFDTFRIRKNQSFGNTTIKLEKVDYEEWLEAHADSEYSTQGSFSSAFSSAFATTIGEAVPRFVFQTQDLKYGVWPIPDKAYILDYEYFALPVDLEDYDDVPSVPESFAHVILYGALMHMYSFRDDIEGFDRYRTLFEDGVGNLRTLYINRYDSIRDRRVQRNTATRFIEVD